jgi:CelD/BcsL family acetyltransferase involved in cellulose biosynthesis
LPGSWESYLGEFSKSRARHARRLRRKLDEDDRFVVHWAEDASDLDGALEILILLHQRRRKSLGDPGCFADERFKNFLQDAVRRLCQARQLQICWLTLDDQPVAADFNLITPEGTLSYQSGVDPDSLDHSPGHMLFMAQILKSIESGQHMYDLLRGDESYKADWGAEPESLLRLRVVPRRAVPQFRHGVWLAGVTMRGWIKSGLTRIAPGITN